MTLQPVQPVKPPTAVAVVTAERRVQPGSRLEGTTIGAMVMDLEACYRGLQSLTVDHFVSSRARVAFRSIAELWDAAGAVDLVSLDAHLCSTGRIGDVGYDWAEWALGLQVAPHSMMPVYCRQLEDLRVKRAVLIAGVQAGQHAEARDAEACQATMEAGAALKPARAVQKGHREGVAEALAQMEGEATVDVAMGTGLPSLDRLLGGLHRGRVCCLTGDTASGKSALALQIALSVAQQGGRVVYWSREMPSDECYRRMAAILTGCYTGHRAVRGWSPDDREAVRQAMHFLADLPMVIDQTTGDHAAMMRQARKERGQVALYVIDHAQIVRVRGDGPDERLSRISGDAKGILALECGASVLLLSQMNRGGAKGETSALHALKGSGSLEQDADAVLEIVRPPKRPGPAQTAVSIRGHKVRQMGPGECRLRWDGPRMMFYELEGDGDE